MSVSALDQPEMGSVPIAPTPEIGRPPKYVSADEFTAVADSYFGQCLADDVMPTVNGLSLALDITRETLLRYGEKPAFSDAVKRVRARLELAWELRLADTACTGAIFWLKNQGWKDKFEQEHTGPNGSSLFAGIQVTFVRPDQG